MGTTPYTRPAFPTPLSKIHTPAAITKPKRSFDLPTAPSGLGLDSLAVRQQMVARLRQQEQKPLNEAVLAAMAHVPRHVFVDSALANQAYEDTSLPIGFGQTASKPSVVARMLSLLCEGKRVKEWQNTQQAILPLRVLEIGTGCGYQAALLAHLFAHVDSVECIAQLHAKAQKNLALFPNIKVNTYLGNATQAFFGREVYDGIISAAAGPGIPPAWLKQLSKGGRIVAPVIQANRGQVLVVVDKTPQGTYHKAFFEAVHFVPLVSL